MFIYILDNEDNLKHSYGHSVDTDMSSDASFQAAKRPFACGVCEGMNPCVHVYVILCIPRIKFCAGSSLTSITNPQPPHSPAQGGIRHVWDFTKPPLFLEFGGKKHPLF